MKHWWEYYLAKHKRKHFGRINIDNFDKIISYMCLNLQLGVKINVCVLHQKRLFIIYGCTSGAVDMEAKVPLQNICLYPPFCYELNTSCTDGATGFLPIPLVVASSPTVLCIWSFTCWSWHSDNEISFDGKGTMVCYLFKYCSNTILQL